MKPEYFIVRIFCDKNGEAILETEETIDYLTNINIIAEAETNQNLRIKNGRSSKADIIAEAIATRKQKTTKVTIPEIPVVIQSLDYNKIEKQLKEHRSDISAKAKRYFSKIATKTNLPVVKK